MFKSGFLLFAFALIAIVFADPNEEFAQCCTGKSVPDSCIKYCTYDATPPPALNFFRKKPKFSDDNECYADDVMSKIMQCSQKGKDNTECCKTAGVGDEHDFCLELCDGTKPISNDEKYHDCVDVANKDLIEEYLIKAISPANVVHLLKFSSPEASNAIKLHQKCMKYFMKCLKETIPIYAVESLGETFLASMVLKSLHTDTNTND